MLIAKWLSEAWTEYFEHDGQATVVDAFQRVGLMNAYDGSEDHLVKVQGVENYSFGEESEVEESESDSESGEEESDLGSESDEEDSDLDSESGEEESEEKESGEGGSDMSDE